MQAMALQQHTALANAPHGKEPFDGLAILSQDTALLVDSDASFSDGQHRMHWSKGGEWALMQVLGGRAEVRSEGR